MLMDEARVVLTPGHSQLADEPGWFRLCFGWVVEEALIVGMKRMRRVLYRRRYGDSDRAVSRELGLEIAGGGKGATDKVVANDDEAA